MEGPKSRTLAAPNAGKDVEQQEFLFISGGNAYWYSILEDILPVSYKPKHTLPIWFSNCVSWQLPKEVENVCPHKTLHRDVYISFICNFLNLEVTKCPLVDEWKINSCTTRQWNIIQCSKDWAIKPWKDTEDSKCIFINENQNKPIWKGYIHYDSNHTKLWKRQNYGDNKKISL